MTKPRSRDLSRALAAPRVDLESAYAALVDLAVDPLADAELRCTLASMDLQDALDDLAALGVDPGRLVYKVLGVGETALRRIKSVPWS